MNPQPRTSRGAPQAAPLLYGSVCSGIEAVSLAWQPLGLKNFSSQDAVHYIGIYSKKTDLGRTHTTDTDVMQQSGLPQKGQFSSG